MINKTFKIFGIIINIVYKKTTDDEKINKNLEITIETGGK